MHSNNFSQSGPRITEKTLESLEKQLSCKLPDDYRSFLLEHNGGNPDKAFFHYKGDPILSSVDWLCTIDENLAGPSPSSHYMTLAAVRAVHGTIVPDDMLIIGYVDQDDPLLLSIRGDRKGMVFVKKLGDMEPNSYEELATHPEKEVYEVAESLASFMEALDYSPDE